MDKSTLMAKSKASASEFTEMCARAINEINDIMTKPAESNYVNTE